MTASMNRPLSEVDAEIAEAIANEEQRLAYNLEMIASENFVSEAVLEAQGSVLTNKYAEGYPGQALLRRLRIRRRGGEPCARAGEAAFGARARQRAAALGRAGEHGRLPDACLNPATRCSGWTSRTAAT